MDQPSYRSRELLAPPAQGWMALTLLASVVLDLVPRLWVGWGPEATLLTLTFWALRAPAWCGIGLALFLGLLVDVGRSAVLGQTALAAVWLVWGAQQWRARLLWFGPWGQVAHLFWLWATVLALQAAVCWLAVGEFDPVRDYGWAPVWMALLWPLWHTLLLWPQRARSRTAPGMTRNG